MLAVCAKCVKEEGGVVAMVGRTWLSFKFLIIKIQVLSVIMFQTVSFTSLHLLMPLRLYLCIATIPNSYVKSCKEKMNVHQLNFEFQYV